MREAGIRRLSKSEHGGEYRDSVRQNMKQIMEMMERIGEERALINALDKKRKRKWIGRTLEGDSLLRMAIERKWRGKRTRARRKQMMLFWMLTGVYGKPQEEAHQREEWRLRPFDPF